MVAVAVGILWLHMSFRPVLSGSMRPDFAPGALLVTRQIPNNRVRVGDVIVLHPPGQTASYAHRVQTVSGPADNPIITTKGDANPAADPWHAQIVTAQTTEVIGSVPAVGRIFVVAQQRVWRLLLIIIAGLAICVGGTWSILGSRRTPGRNRAITVRT
jgi:signal peptidase I